MINLIGNEIKKVFSKIGVKIVILIAVLLMIVAVIISKVFADEIMTTFNERAINEEIVNYETDLKNMKYSDNPELYLDYKTTLDVLKLDKKYPNDEWKQDFITGKGHDLLYNINKLKNTNNVDKEELAEAEKKYDEFVKILDNNEWKEFVEFSLADAKLTLTASKEMLKTSPETQKDEIEKTIKMNEILVEVLEYRLKNEVAYDNSYLDQALQSYQSNMSTVILNQDDNRMPVDDYKAEAMIAKHVLDTKQDLYNSESSAGLFKDYMTSTNVLFLTLIIIIVCGSIVSDEFNKGTIKQLLVRPYSRVKIWLAKFIAAIVVLIISMIIISIFATIIFGIAYGFDGYVKYNIGVYDYNSGSAFSMNTFAYVATDFISKLPYYIMLGTIAIFIGTMLNNTAMGVAIPLLGTISANIVDMLLTAYEKFRFLKYFITPNWDWSIYNY